MAVLRAQVRIPYLSNVPSDVITNTLHFDWDEETPYPDVTTYLTGRLQEFYDAVYSGIAAPWCVWSGVTVWWYNLDDPTPRVPLVRNMPIDIGASPANSTTPLEVAVVLSFQGLRQAGVPQSRRRGRIYLGGFSNVLSGGSSSTFPQIQPTARNTIATAASTWLLDTEDIGLTWVVWSRTTNEAVPVANGWIDNEPDTQRRRGRNSTSRTIWQ